MKERRNTMELARRKALLRTENPEKKGMSNTITMELARRKALLMTENPEKKGMRNTMSTL